MKKFLLFSSVLMVSLFGTHAFGQLPNMQVVSHAGSIAVHSEVSYDGYAGYNVVTPNKDQNLDQDDDNIIDVTYDTTNGVQHERRIMTNSHTKSTLNFTQDATASYYTQDEGHSISFTNYSKIDVEPSSYLNGQPVTHGGTGESNCAGWHGRIVRPGNIETWSTQDVGANIKMTSTGRVCSYSSTIVRMDETQLFIKAMWGDNYIYARFDEEEDAWEVTYSCKWTPNGSVEADVIWTLSRDLDIDVNVYQTVTSSSYIYSGIDLSTNEEYTSNELDSYGGNHFIYQQANSHTGSGGGAGTTTTEASGEVGVTILANLKQ